MMIITAALPVLETSQSLERDILSIPEMVHLPYPHTGPPLKRPLRLLAGQRHARPCGRLV